MPKLPVPPLIGSFRSLRSVVLDILGRHYDGGRISSRARWGVFQGSLILASLQLDRVLPFLRRGDPAGGTL